MRCVLLELGWILTRTGAWIGGQRQQLLRGLSGRLVVCWGKLRIRMRHSWTFSHRPRGGVLLFGTVGGRGYGRDCAMEESRSVALVNVSAMPDSDHEDEEDIVVNLVDDPIVAGAHSPFASPPTNFLAPLGLDSSAKSSMAAWIRR